MECVAAEGGNRRQAAASLDVVPLPHQRDCIETDRQGAPQRSDPVSSQGDAPIFHFPLSIIH